MQCATPAVFAFKPSLLHFFLGELARRCRLAASPERFSPPSRCAACRAAGAPISRQCCSPADSRCIRQTILVGRGMGGGLLQFWSETRYAPEVSTYARVCVCVCVRARACVCVRQYESERRKKIFIISAPSLMLKFSVIPEPETAQG